MAFCPNCGSNVEGRFCAKCGTSVAPPAGAAPSGGAGAGYAQAPGQAPAAGPAYSAPPPPYNPPPPGYGQQPGQPGYGAAPPPPPGYGAGPGAPPPPGYAAPGGYVPPPPGAASTGLADNIAGALCYTPFVGWIIAIVFLVMEPYNRNRNVRFHAFQGLFFAIGIFIINIILSTLLFSALFGVGMWATFTMVFWLIRLVFLAAFLFLMWKAYNNERFVVPIIGPLSEQQANK